MQQVKQANYQDLLKFIAIIAMVIDHIGIYFFSDYHAFRLIGRISMPLFCFFAGYNFKKKPNLMILWLGLIMEEVYTILFGNFLPINILITIFFGQYYLYFFRNYLSSFNKVCWHILILTILGNASGLVLEYGSLGIAIMILGYNVQVEKECLKLCAAISIILTLYYSLSIFNFSHVFVIIHCLLSIIEYFLIIKKDFNQVISFNIALISRHSLFIYCTHLLLIEICYIYFL